jgi:hypothetical protein
MARGANLGTSQYLRFDDRQLFAFTADSEEKLLDIYAERADAELLPALPVFIPGPGRPLPGRGRRNPRGWSPPGNLRASYHLQRGTDFKGHHELTIWLDRVYRFSSPKAKHAHRIPRVVEHWLAEQAGKPVT